MVSDKLCPVEPLVPWERTTCSTRLNAPQYVFIVLSFYHLKFIGSLRYQCFDACKIPAWFMICGSEVASSEVMLKLINISFQYKIYSPATPTNALSSDHFRNCVPHTAPNREAKRSYSAPIA